MSTTNKKGKVIVIAGFLGAGKTTLLKRILSWEDDFSKTVIIVNEFGDIGIDGSLLKGAGADVMELAGGCICCSMKADLKALLQRIQAQFTPRKVFIEATGVADPAAILDLLNDRALQPHMEVHKVITVLEGDLWEDRTQFGAFFLSQLKEANLILLNKIDNIDQNKIPKILGEIHEEMPGAQVVPTIHCSIDPGSLWTGAKRARRGPDHDHHPSKGEKLGYVAFSFVHPEPLDEHCFRRFTQELPWELFRMKGFVRFRDRTVMVNHVGGKSEWIEWAAPEQTHLAFVGLNVSREETTRKLETCIARS